MEVPQCHAPAPPQNVQIPSGTLSLTVQKHGQPSRPAHYPDRKRLPEMQVCSRPGPASEPPPHRESGLLTLAEPTLRGQLLPSAGLSPPPPAPALPSPSTSHPDAAFQCGRCIYRDALLQPCLRSTRLTTRDAAPVESPCPFSMEPFLPALATRLASLVCALFLWATSGLCACSCSELLPLADCRLFAFRSHALFIISNLAHRHLPKCLQKERVSYSKPRGSMFGKQYLRSQRTPLGP